jgi:hypothetical protein
MAGLSRFFQASAAFAVCFAALPALAQPSHVTSAFYVAEIDIYHGKSVSPWPGERMVRDRGRGWLRVQSTPILTGRDVATVSVGSDSARRPTLRIRLTHDGAEALAFYIDGHIDFLGAVVLDGKVLSTPVLDGKMEDSGEIELHGDLGSDARQIAARIQQIADSERAGRR